MNRAGEMPPCSCRSSEALSLVPSTTADTLQLPVAPAASNGTHRACTYADIIYTLINRFFKTSLKT